MDNHDLIIHLKNIRAIEKADIILDGITVITGENGCGKSTISKLAYHLFKTAIDLDKIIEESSNQSLNEIFSTLWRLAKEFPQFLLDDDEHTRAFNLQAKLFGNDSTIKKQAFANFVIDSWIKILEETVLFEEVEQQYIFRIKKILENLVLAEDSVSLDIVDLFKLLKRKISDVIKNTSDLKATRPTSILYEVLDNIIYGEKIARTYNANEYGTPLINIDMQKLLTIESIKNLVYVDSPITFGFDGPVRDAMLNKSSRRFRGEKIFTLTKEIIKGDTVLREDPFSGKSFIYKRADGQEFNLLECATGIKSFATLQLLLKNGFLTNKTLLIIDEPEAHLHPQWVVEYARLIVLLHKYVGVRFLIASHHPDMVSAIKYIAEKEQVDSKLNYYLAEKVEDKYTYNYRSLGTNIDPIFASFNIAFERMDLYGKTE